VLAVSALLAPVLDATVEAVHVVEDGDRTVRAACQSAGVPLRLLRGDPVAELVRASRAQAVVAAVAGARARPVGPKRTGHLALALARQIEQPVVIVPPEARVPTELHRVLVAMEGTPRDARRLKRAIKLAEHADLEVVVLHVDDESSIPLFSDQVQHETEAYADQFLARFVPGAKHARLELRVGVPVDEILLTADQEEPDLLAMGLPHVDDPHRGEVVRSVLDRSHVPLMLVGTT
jgi:nucleotide-binding universal stress UspA family protein